MSAQYVQHISGQGRKWEVLECPVAQNKLKPPLWIDPKKEWVVRSADDKEGWHLLPTSEYIICDPSEIWDDVTADCEFKLMPNLPVPAVEIWHKATRTESVNVTFYGNLYRLRKMELWKIGHGCTQWAFIVERKRT